MAPRPPDDPDRYYAALVISVDLCRDALRTQLTAVTGVGERREELARLAVLLAGGAVAILTTGLTLRMVTDWLGVTLFAAGFSFNMMGIIVLSGFADVTEWRDGPSLEALAAAAADRDWSDHRLLLSLTRTYPLLHRKNDQMLRRAGRIRAGAFALLIVALVHYLLAGSYILWRTIHG